MQLGVSVEPKQKRLELSSFFAACWHLVEIQPDPDRRLQALS